MAINSYDVCEKKKFKRHDPKSPYLTSDRVQLLSRVTEKRFIQKKTMDYVSSFPLAVNIYKANSDEFKCLKRAKKKIKKSVLTLPNEPSPSPQVCTVSDMNDSEYYSQNNDNQDTRIKKRSSIKNVRKSRPKNKDFEYYDRDARYCSQLNINLDSSSTDLIKDYKGDGNKHANRQKGYKCSYSSQRNKENEADIKPHDVWAVLRNMKRFQFKPSPPVSDESILTPKKKKKKATKKHVNCKDTRVIETCRTEEIAYISRYKVDETNHSLSQTSSFDRITVINKQDEFSKICKKFEERFLKTGFTDLSKNDNRLEGNNKVQKGRPKKNLVKCVGPTQSKENIELSVPKINDMCVKVENYQEIYKSNNTAKVSSLINIDDPCNGDHSDHTSVCSNTNNADKEIKTECAEPVKECGILSDNSGSSKAEFTADKSKKIKGKIGLNGRVPHLKGISRVIFGTKREPVSQVASRRTEEQKRKSGLVATMPSGNAMPKLTKTEIKRRLATMKFPLVVSGKDQVNPAIAIQLYDHPQFDGLDKHIWPFMVGWDDINQFKSEENLTKNNIESKDNNNSQLLRKPNNCCPDNSLNKLRKNNNEVAPIKRTNYKPKKYNEVTTNKNKIELQGQAVNIDITNKIQPFKKQESINNLKDKMLNLLYKKISDKRIVNDDYNNTKESVKQPRSPSSIIKADAYTEIQIKSTTIPAKPKGHGSPIRNQNKRCRSGLRRSHPWAKAKWASDFIENVIKKIKNGVYYNQGVAEISIQTDPTFDQEIISEHDLSPKVTIRKRHLDIPKVIPGFENSLPGLEIKTLNMNQISIKHCIANVMMQFDVTVPGETKQLMSSKAAISLIPLEGTESNTKVFKCKTSIVNAMLPAELCSILPKMMSLFESDLTSSIRPAICPALIHKKELHLTTIRETPPIEIFNTIIQSPVIPKSPVDLLPPNIRKMLEGVFSKTCSMTKVGIKQTKAAPLISYDTMVVELLPKVFFKDTDILTYRIRSMIPISSNLKENTIPQITLPAFLQQQSSNCTALQLYVSKNKTLVPPFEPYDFITSIRNILLRQTEIIINFNLKSKFNLVRNQYITQISKLPAPKAIMTKLHITVKNLAVESKTHEDKSKLLAIQNRPSQKCIEYIKRSSSSYEYETKHQHSETEFKVTNKSKRRGFYRLYRKCKSTTNIPTGEKCLNTPLNKIQNVEDFFQVLGSKKIMSSVFDGYAARKILSSIVELKNWITDINPRQALLVLLLTNKKDTPNLIRFRPILLQGIAVNRITRATELDMEIEVIEREHLNKLSQYEGMSYLPSSVENHDQLLEELYWIAKTTASDYQRPFDESAERLLRSLLEKRKKLNPSYLRVMARYVGLGLLKPPTKK